MVVLKAGFGIDRFVCAIEEYKSKPGNYHTHIFFVTSEKVFLNDIREYLVANFPDSSINVQKCNSEKNALVYVTKEDADALYENVSVSKLSFFFQLHEWARRTSVFSYSDPFVCKHRHVYHFIEKSYSDIRRKMQVSFHGFKPRVFCHQVPWAIAVVQWWNKRIITSGLRRQQLYLYGDTGFGKSTLVEQLIGRENMKYVFYPDVGKFAFQDFDVNFHKLILFEEFNIDVHIDSFLKRLLEGRTFAAPVKGCSSKLLSFHGPVIFVSNFEKVQDMALRSRLLFVQADAPYYEAPSGPLPKEEERDSGEELETFEISSTSSSSSEEEV